MDEKYLKIPDDVINNKTICLRSKMLYGIISLMCYQYGYCYATNKFFSEKLNVTTRTISRLINELKNSNYIIIKYEDSYIRKIYINR